MSRHSPVSLALILLVTTACSGEDKATSTTTAGSPALGAGEAGRAGSRSAGVAGKPSVATAGKPGPTQTAGAESRPRAGSSASGNAGSGNAGAGSDDPALRFSFFVTSLKAMQELSGNDQGFGGDLRFGETGDGAGLRGADKICTTIAEKSMPGSGKKQWRAFLSATRGGANGGPVHAIDRVGEGPWYDRAGRLVSKNKADLMQVRPASAADAIKNDLPNEEGVPNHNPDGSGEVDNHDILTGTNDKGQLYRDDPRVTCNDWTNSVPDVADAPRVGHSWPRSFGGRPGRPGGGRPGGSGMMGGRPMAPDAGRDNDDDNGGLPGDFSGENWMSALDESGCGAEVSIIEMGPPNLDNPTVGSGGGYGGIYCFALTP